MMIKRNRLRPAGGIRKRNAGARTRAVTPLLVTAALAVIAGCGGGGGRGSQNLDDITRSRKVWEACAVSDYSFTFAQNAFVDPSARGPVRITVRNRTMTAVEPVEPGQIINREAFVPYNTIDKLFDTLEASRKRNPALQRQTFNGRYGYPESAYIDYSAQMADEEFGFEVTNFTPFTPGG